MSYVDWSIKGPEFVNCNCAYGCPCQFNALPTYGDCKAYTAMRIDEGHFGEVPLDGLSWVLILNWPGAVHEGNGTCQAIIDERGNDQQRDALSKIAYGKETVPGGTVLQVFNSTMRTVLDPIFKPIEFSVNIEERTARLVVPGIIESTIDPIRNPITGNKHRKRINLPNGFEYTSAEIAS